MGVKQIFGPGHHPQSVALAERYVQLVMKVMRAVLQHHPELIFEWDKFLAGVVKGRHACVFLR